MMPDNDRPNLEVLGPGMNEGYLKWSIPHERDGQIAEVVDRFARDIEQGRPRAPLNGDQGKALAGFAERMAALAVRERDPEHLRRGLLALGLAASVSYDIREEILVMPLLWRSAELLGIDPAHEFTAIGAAVGGPGGEQLVSFVRRSARDRGIEAMGYVEDTDEGGFRYRRTW